MSEMSNIPYCGPPVAPSELWSRWNLDPVLIACLIAIGIAYAAGVGAARRNAEGSLSALEHGLFYAGWAVAFVALISPLCALSVSLFSARVGQHMILTMIAAPLIALGRPGNAFGVLRPAELDLSAATGANGAWWAAGLFGVMLWLWHAPTAYQATFSSAFIYWTMHVSLFGSAFWLWSTLIARAPRVNATAVGSGVASSAQMGFLGALITFAPRPLYPPHLLTTGAWDLTPLQDQQIGGVIMWVPGCVIFLAVAMLALGRMLESGDRSAIPRAVSAEPR